MWYMCNFVMFVNVLKKIFNFLKVFFFLLIMLYVVEDIFIWLYMDIFGFFKNIC